MWGSGGSHGAIQSELPRQTSAAIVGKFFLNACTAQFEPVRRGTRLTVDNRGHHRSDSSCVLHPHGLRLLCVCLSSLI
jgi:hypothetical protein